MPRSAAMCRPPSDVDGDTLNYQLVAGSVLVDGVAAPDGTVTFNADGSYSYDPSGDQDLDDGETRIYHVQLRRQRRLSPTALRRRSRSPSTGPTTRPVERRRRQRLAAARTMPRSPAMCQPPLTSTAITLSYQLVRGSVVVDRWPAPDGTVTLNADGSYSYDPSGDQDLDDGESRIDHVQLRRQRRRLPTALQATVTITVDGANDAPVTQQRRQRQRQRGRCLDRQQCASRH